LNSFSNGGFSVGQNDGYDVLYLCGVGSFKKGNLFLKTPKRTKVD